MWICFLISFRAFAASMVGTAQRIMSQPAASRARICSTVAFEDQSYFCKVFKRYVGVTPDRYRKRQRRLDLLKEHGGEESREDSNKEKSIMKYST